MSELSKIRLNKVLRELNISLDRVIEFLNEKGHEVDARPTTKISNEIYELLLNEFKSDKSDKAETDEVLEVKRKEKEVLRIKQEKIELEKLKIEEEKKIIKASKFIIQKPKQIDKIQLENKEFGSKLNKDGSSKVHEKSDLSLSKNDDLSKNEKENISTPETKEDKNLVTKYKKLSGPKVTGEKLNLEEIDKKQKADDDTTTQDLQNKKD